MQTKVMDTAKSFWFESLEEVMTAPIVNVISRKIWEECAQRVGWIGASLTQMNEWLTHGWTDGLKRVQGMLDDIGELDVVPAEANLRRRTRRRGDHGDALHIDRVWNGDLDRAWDLMKHENRRMPTCKFVSLFVNLNTPGGVSWHDTLWRSVAVVKIVDALQRSGRNVRVTAGQIGNRIYNGSPNYKSVHAVRIKDFNSPLSLQHLVVSSTAMFYRLGVFRMLSMGEADYSVSSSYGDCPPESTIRHIFPHVLHEDELERQAMLVRVDNCYSKKSAIRVCENVKQQLLSLEEGKYHGFRNNDGDKRQHLQRGLWE